MRCDVDDEATDQLHTPRRAQRALTNMPDHFSPDAELAEAEHEWWGWPAQQQTASNPFESMPWPTLTTPPELPQEVRAPKLEEVKDNQVVTADRWKTISQMPTFDPASGNASPWEVGLRYEVWKKQVLTTASAISPSFVEYVKKCFEEGLRRHHEQIQGNRAAPLQPIQGFPAEFEARFVMSLLTILPDNIKTPALEGDNVSDNIRSVRLIEEILLRVQPGGLEEQSTLMRFVRGLQPAASAKEALDLIRRWKLAKQRIASLGLPEPACFEQLKGIGVLLGRLEKKHEQLRMRLALLRLNPDVQMGKPGAVETILDNCDQQLRQIAADETSKEGGNSESIIAVTKGTGKGLSKEDKKKITCPFLAKPGGCSFGDRCHYSHANQPRAKPKAEPKRGVPPAKSEPAPKKKCIFHARKTGCKKGDACEYLHEGPSGAAQAAAGGPGLVGGTASQVDTGTSSASDSKGTKAKAKAKTTAKAAPKVCTAHSTVSSFACMFASRPLRSQGVAAVPLGELWMCEMGPDELIHWMKNPFGVTGFFTSTTDSLLGSAWLAAFDANRFDALADIDPDLGGGNSIIDVSLATAWNQRTLEHETCFVFIIHTSAEDYLHVALMVAEHRPGCDRPMNDLQKRRWAESFVARPIVEEMDGEQEETQSVHPSFGDDSELSSLSEGTEDSEGSTVSFDSRGYESDDQVESFWYLVLSRDEYLEWKRPGTLITRARNPFKPVVGSTSVATGIWRALESVDFSLPLRQLAMGQGQVILEAQTVYVLHADRVFRECVLVWILDMDSGQEQFLILAKGVVAPRVERDIRQVTEPSQAAPPRRSPPGGDMSSSSQGIPQVDACISAVNQQGSDGILLDSGANEILRQVRVTPKNSIPLPLQLADGQNIMAHRTCCGEVVIQGEPGEFICGVNRLIQIGCKFEWEKTGAYLTLPDGCPLVFDPHEWHGTEPWIGERCTIVAYTSGAWEQCSGDEKAELARLGFPLPRSNMVATAEQTTADIDTVPVHTTVNSEGNQKGLCERDFTEGVQGVQGRRDVQSCAHGASVLESDLEYEPSLLADAPVLESEPELILDPDQDLPVADEDSPYEYAHKQKPDHTVADFGSRGTLRPHRRLSRDDVAQGCLSIDITGPFKKGFGDYRYALIGNFNAPESDPLYFCRPLKRRLKAEVIGVVFDMVAQIHSMAGARPEVVRLHSDCAAEFVAKDMKAAAEQKGIYRTMSVPYEHASNGRAERAIRYLKERATKFILESGAPSELWPFALCEAAIVQREEVLNLKRMKNQPKPWMLVAINIHSPEPFTAKTETARFLCRDEHTSSGALCMVSRNGRQVITTARLPAVIPVDQRVWRTHTTPLGDLVWVSDRGDVRDADALRDIGQDLGLITYEESQLGPSPNAGNFPVHIAAKTVSAPHRCTCKRCTLKRHSEPADATAYQVGDADEETTADEKAALLQEVMAAKASAETLTTSVLFQGTPERREKWYKAAVKEMDGMKAKNVLEDLDRDHLREQLGLNPDEPIPEILPCKLVVAAKPEDVAPITVSGDGTNADPAEQPWKAKIRLCACGNFEGAREHEDNTTSNVSPIALRLMAHELAKHKSWVGANGDVSMAFLNTELEPSEIVLLEPPSALKKLGLVAPRTIWRARRYIYGLRRSPKKWARLRDDTMHGKSLKYDGNRELVISLVDEQEGIFHIRDSASQELVALCAMYVDDIWCIGLPSAVTAILGFVSGTWETKLGGFISRDPSVTISVNGEALPRLDEITFIGQQFRFEGDEVVISQRCWLLNELAKRNWLHLKGTPSLPILEQGPDEDRESGEYKRHLQEAQTEVGCLMWLSTKTRPDILASVSQVASLMHRRPLRVIQVTRGIWRYLRSTLSLSLHFNGHDEGHLEAYSDASHAPEGGRSRSGGVVMLGSSPIAWWTSKQTVTAWSTCESEMDAMALTISETIKIQALIENMTGWALKSSFRIYGDNAAAVTVANREHFTLGAWRTRTFALRAEWVRDQMSLYDLALLHHPGESLVADMLTKTLPRMRLQKLRELLCLK
ncbi:RE1 [Symbiodinium sp. CCMP2592]|nr:RE1 [Symbiodinium sp. CCMP2592]